MVTVSDFNTLRRTWHALGESDPLWAVLTDDDHRGGRWDREEFLATGREEFDRWLAWFDELAVDVRPSRRVLDFGCGAGRMSQALAEHFGEVVGLDVAPSMVAVASDMNERANVRFVSHGRPDLSLFPSAHFDFVYSVLVLQHIRPEFIRSYLAEFARVLTQGGVLAFQLPSELQFPPGDSYSARLELAAPPVTRMAPGERAVVHVRVTNTSPQRWSLRYVFALANHWRRDGEMVVQDDGRIWLANLEPEESAVVQLEVTAPGEPGPLTLELDVVAEGITWFASQGSPTITTSVEVVGEALPQLPPEERPARMEMNSIPVQEVRALLTQAGLDVIEAKVSNRATGWIDYWYLARKPTWLRRTARRYLPLAARRAARARLQRAWGAR